MQKQWAVKSIASQSPSLLESRFWSPLVVSTGKSEYSRYVMVWITSVAGSGHVTSETFHVIVVSPDRNNRQFKSPSHTGWITETEQLYRSKAVAVKLASQVQLRNRRFWSPLVEKSTGNLLSVYVNRFGLTSVAGFHSQFPDTGPSNSCPRQPDMAMQVNSSPSLHKSFWIDEPEQFNL